MNLVGEDEQQGLISHFSDRNLSMLSGGSVANSIIAMTELGGKGAYLGSVGDDAYGLHYLSEMESLGINFPNKPHAKKITGTSFILTTPDAERTMQTCLAVSGTLSAENINEEVIADSKWIFIEGYLLSNPEFGQEAVWKAIEFAEKHDTKIAFTFSDAFLVHGFRDAVDRVVKHSDLIFANEGEALAYTGGSSITEALDKLAEVVPSIALTAGDKGACGVWNQTKFKVDSFPCEPKDLTGAGDMFAGAFLRGVLEGRTGEESARMACYMAREVIIRVGARLQTGINDYWQSAAKLNLAN
ncbi:MAG: adenosine kinase [Bdellovibrionota bacterium]